MSAIEMIRGLEAAGLLRVVAVYDEDEKHLVDCTLDPEDCVTCGRLLDEAEYLVVGEGRG